MFVVGLLTAGSGVTRSFDLAVGDTQSNDG